MIAEVMTEPEALRSCFINFDNIDDTACSAITALETAPVVPYWINGISRHEDHVSVYFALHCDHMTPGGLKLQDEFIAHAETLGGRYSGS